jgi:acyl-CoA synthetase (AMP-forming)/AMP-acid ligase II
MHKTHSEKPAIIIYGRKSLIRNWMKASDQFAYSLLDLGLVKGDRVGLFLGNSPQ